MVKLRKTISRAGGYRDNPDVNVINLSKHSFTKKQFKLKKPNENNNTSSDITKSKPKLTWELVKNHHTISTFIEALNKDVD